MTWRNDAHGLVFKSNEIKLYRNGKHTWAMKLSQLARQKGTVRIITYSLPELDYVIEQFNRRPRDLFLVCHAKFRGRAEQVKTMLPGVNIAVNDSVHSKVCLIEPATVYIGSANFGRSGWHETIVGIRSRQAHDWYVKNSFRPLWANSQVIRGECFRVGDYAKESA